MSEVSTTDVSAIELPNGNLCALKDTTARAGLDDKLDIAQGVENAGKPLAINSDGDVEPVAFNQGSVTTATVTNTVLTITTGTSPSIGSL